MSNNENLIARLQILPKLRGQHNTAKSYAKLDEVYHNASVYQASETIPAGTPITDSRWVLRLDNSQIYNAETARAQAETNRVNAEGNRVSAEEARVIADAGRDLTNAAFVGNDIVLTKANQSTVVLAGAKTALKGDTGAQGPIGNVMYATFDIDFDTGELMMTTPDGYTGPTFSINDETGELEVSI